MSLFFSITVHVFIYGVFFFLNLDDKSQNSHTLFSDHLFKVGTNYSVEIQSNHHKSVSKKSNESEIQKTLEDIHANDAELTGGHLMNDVYSEGFSKPPRLLQASSIFKRSLEAQKARFEGESFVELTLNETGEVLNYSLQNSLPYNLNEKTIEIIRQLKFSPAEINQKPVKSRFIFKIQYRNEDSF